MTGDMLIAYAASLLGDAIQVWYLHGFEYTGPLARCWHPIVLPWVVGGDVETALLALNAVAQCLQ